MDRKTGRAVFVHIDGISARIGNGGFVMLSRLAHRLDSMGYDVAVFDHEDRLEPVKWEPLSMSPPRIVSFDMVASVKGHAPIISGWLDVLLDGNVSLVGGIAPGRIRYWDGEILRNNLYKGREFVLNFLRKIAIPNASLEPYYREIGYTGRIIPLNNWIRDDLFIPPRDEKRYSSIGYQSDNFVYSIYQDLWPRYRDRVVTCEGTQAQVAEKMQACDYFIQWNRHSPAISLFEGETFGLSLFEAMACRCIPVARWHQGINFLLGYIPIARSLEEAFDYIDTMERNTELKETIRDEAHKVLEREFRFNKQRRDALEELLA